MGKVKMLVTKGRHIAWSRWAPLRATVTCTLQQVVVLDLSELSHSQVLMTAYAGNVASKKLTPKLCARLMPFSSMVTARAQQPRPPHDGRSAQFYFTENDVPRLCQQQKLQPIKPVFQTD